MRQRNRRRTCWRDTQRTFSEQQTRQRRLIGVRPQLPCFGAVTLAGCAHQSAVVAGRKPKDVPELQWINTVPGNLKTGLSGSYHGFGFRKYAERYLGAFVYRFIRRFDLRTFPQRLLVAALQSGPHPQWSIRVVADVHCSSGLIKLSGQRF